MRLRKRLFVTLFLLRRSNSTSATFAPKHIETIPAGLHRYLFNTEPPDSSVHDSRAAVLDNIQMPSLRHEDLMQHFICIANEKVQPYRGMIDDMMQWDLPLMASFLGDRNQKLTERNFSFAFTEGWTRYDLVTGRTEQVSHPLEPCCVFDVEVCVTDGKLPTMATALTSKAWYSWCSSRLVSNTDYPDFPTLSCMIPLAGNSQEELALERLVLGHNVGFDRARIREPYAREKSGIRYLDTMAMGKAIFGISDHQEGIYNMDDVTEPKNRPRFAISFEDRRDKEMVMDTWRLNTTKVSLKDLCAFLATNQRDISLPLERLLKINKMQRDSFVKDPIDYFRDTVNFQESMLYCAYDVLACAAAFQCLMKHFDTMYPNPVTLFGLLNIGNAYLPINQYWPLFYSKNEEIRNTAIKENAQNIVRCARELALQIESGGNDLWLWNESWKINKNGQIDWITSLFKTPKNSHIETDTLNSDDISTNGKLIPKIFGMLYGPYPLYNHSTHGYGFLVPDDVVGFDPDEVVSVELSKNEVFEMPLGKLKAAVVEWRKEFGEVQYDPLDATRDSIAPGVSYYRLPKDTDGGVQSPFAKSYRSLLEKKVLRPTRGVDLKMNLTTMSRQKLKPIFGQCTQIHVWYPDECGVDPGKMSLEEFVEKPPQMKGALAPALCPAGTVSRRTVHKLWVTMTNAKNPKTQNEALKIGTHLKSMVQAPPGYCLIGADVDSQEQWLAALFGDASDAVGLADEERRPGRTPFSNMALAGQKSDGSDLHTVVANDLGIDRNQAKTLNYARLYGSGREHATNFLIQNGTDSSTAKSTAERLFEMTKGKELRFRELKAEVTPFFRLFCEQNSISDGFLRIQGCYFLPDYLSDPRSVAYRFETWLLQQLQDLNGQTVEAEQAIPALYENYSKAERFYMGGYESSTFNYLVWSARQQVMRTPVLNCVLGSCFTVPTGEHLSQRGRDLFLQEHMRSRMNWIVQSSAVDFLHLLLLSMDWICSEYKIDSRFVISIHDEVRYLCREEDAPRCALALMLSHAHVRAVISSALGIRQLPMNIAFFSQVDKDTVLRKEVDTPCQNPDGTHPPNGVTWDIYKVLELTGGRLSK